MRSLRKSTERCQRMERAIVRRVIADALRWGYVLSVNDGEDTTVTRSGNAKEIFAAMMTTDEDYLLIYSGPTQLGWVRFVYGNSGWDVICDYSVNIEAVLAGADKLAERLEVL